MASNLAHAINYGGTMEEAFPQVKHGLKQLSLTNYLVQLRCALVTTKGGLVMPHAVLEAEAANTTVGMVVGIGPNCFKDSDGTPWPEGPSFKMGDYLLVPRHGGFRFSRKFKDDEVNFVIFDHLQQLAVVEDPLSFTSFE